METQYDKIFVPVASDASVTFDLKKIGFGVRFNNLKLSAEKSVNSLNGQFELTQNTIERIRRSCQATQEHCPQQIEFLNLQRAELKLAQ